jgi:hypothetical protein
VSNPETSPLPANPRVIGKDGDFFTVTPATATIAPGASAEFQVTFAPGGFGGRYSAAVQFGPEDTGAFVVLNSVGHGEGTQPTLQEIIDTLSVPVTVGTGRWQDDKPFRLGEGIHARSFVPTREAKAYILPVAAFPDDDKPLSAVSLFTDVDTALKSTGASLPSIGLDPGLIGKCQSGSLKLSDFHEFAAPDAAFALSLGEHSSTNPDRRSDLPLRHKARIFKASRVLESKLDDAYLVCFETGGLCDYNDAIFLVANVAAWKLPEPRPQQEDKRWTLKEIRKGLGLAEQ